MLPAFSDVTPTKSIFLSKTFFRLLQRIVAKDGFHGSYTVRMDDITVESDKKDDKCPLKELISVWFAKALLLLRFDSSFSGTVMKGKQTAVRLATKRRVENYCLIHYYSILHSDFVSGAEIDRLLDSVK